jgi:hypothetical protein
MLLMMNFFNFFLALSRPIKSKAKKSISTIVDTAPYFRVTQLTPTTGICIGSKICSSCPPMRPTEQELFHNENRIDIEVSFQKRIYPIPLY